MCVLTVRKHRLLYVPALSELAYITIPARTRYRKRFQWLVPMPRHLSGRCAWLAIALLDIVAPRRSDTGQRAGG